MLAQERRRAEAYRRYFVAGDYWMREVIAELKEEDGPILIMKLINRVVAHNKFPCWKVRFEKRREILRLISVMLRQGRLERWGRKHVKLPETNEKLEAWLASASKPLGLPEPIL